MTHIGTIFMRYFRRSYRSSTPRRDAEPDEGDALLGDGASDEPRVS